MYFISGVSKNKILVTDTSDGVEDKMTPIEVLKAERMGFKILGLYHSSGHVYFCPYTMDLVRLANSQYGIPLRVRLTEGLGFKQVLYIGHEFKGDKDTFYFFDDSGIDGYFGLTSDYISTNSKSVKFDFDNNEPVRVSILTKRLKDSGGR